SIPVSIFKFLIRRTIMLVLKLDGKVQWNWFLIFLPVWVFDGILILMLAIKMAGRCKPGYDPRNGSPDLRLRCWYLTAMLLKLGFCLTLCAKLEKLADVKNVGFLWVLCWCYVMLCYVSTSYCFFSSAHHFLLHLRHQ
uniref:Transmembrane protein 60 n=1 Tax=Oryzias latipes TaxID=8090 RepID=A0A3P9IHC5_ORYLA